VMGVEFQNDVEDVRLVALPYQMGGQGGLHSLAGLYFREAA
jgi:hypothetical protein